jgi:uncharacterized membrane protein
VLAVMIMLICVAFPITASLVYAAWKHWLENRPIDPLALVASRYASGEIDDAEYARRMKTLTTPPHELPTA